MDENYSRISKRIEKATILLVSIIICTLLYAILVFSSIYILTLINLSSYNLWKDIKAKPEYYTKISFGIAFIFVMSILATNFLIKRLNQGHIGR